MGNDMILVKYYCAKLTLMYLFLFITRVDNTSKMVSIILQFLTNKVTKR